MRRLASTTIVLMALLLATLAAAPGVSAQATRRAPGRRGLAHRWIPG